MDWQVRRDEKGRFAKGSKATPKMRARLRQAHLKLKPRKCKGCGTMFQPDSSRRKYHSWECYDKYRVAWNKGKPLGFIPKGAFKKGNIPVMKGKENPKLQGEKHPQWLGGKSFEPYGVEFNKKLRKQIRGRDNYRCQECFRHQDELFNWSKGKKDKLIVHHIDYNKKNNKPKNLISLCRTCHLQTNFDREDWIKYFQGKAIANG